jgi:phosphoribosylaminoimidazole-succinocarboxamide synthase
MQAQPKYPPYLSDATLIHQGKVRDTYALESYPDLLLMVATDRISTHDVVHLSTVPQKGQFLTAMPVYWSRFVFPNIRTHIVAYGKEIYEYLPRHQSYPDDLHLRSIVVQRVEMMPFELIFRARMAGSLWNKFYSQGKPNPYGLVLPPGLHLMDRFDTPVFTPTEKSETDDPVNADFIRNQDSRYDGAIALACRAYDEGRSHAAVFEVEIIDAKFEVGFDQDGNPILSDEWMTGDCSRFVRSTDIRVGAEPPWMDKEIFRQDAMRQWTRCGIAKGTPLVFPDAVIAGGMQAYRKVFETLSGFGLEEFQQSQFC